MPKKPKPEPTTCAVLKISFPAKSQYGDIVKQLRDEVSVGMTGRAFTGFVDLTRDEIVEMKSQLSSIFARNGLPAQDDGNIVRGQPYWRLYCDPFDEHALPGRGAFAAKDKGLDRGGGQRAF